MLFIVVPNRLKERILVEGYKATLRTFVPCSTLLQAAKKAYGRHHPFEPAVLKVDEEELKKGGYSFVAKIRGSIDTTHLPGKYLSENPLEVLYQCVPYHRGVEWIVDGAWYRTEREARESIEAPRATFRRTQDYDGTVVFHRKHRGKEWVAA